MEIPKAARKCPYCRRFLNLGTEVIQGPWGCILIGFLFSVVIGLNFDDHPDLPRYNGEITVRDSGLTFGHLKSGDTVAVVGTMKNASKADWESVQLKARFLNASGAQVGEGIDEKEAWKLPGGATSSFKISIPRTLDRSNYTSVQVRVFRVKNEMEHD